MSLSAGQGWFDYLIGSATMLAAVIGVFAVFYAGRAARVSGSEGHDWFDYLIGSATVLAAVIGIFAVLYARRAVIAAGLTITQMRQTRYQEDLRGVTAAVDHFRQTYRGSRPKVPGRPLSTDPAIKAAVGKLRVAVGGVPLPQSIKDQFDALATPGRDLGADLDALLRAIQEEQERAFYVGRGR